MSDTDKDAFDFLKGLGLKKKPTKEPQEPPKVKKPEKEPFLKLHIGKSKDG